MIRLIIVLFIIILILFILRSKSKSDIKITQNKYKLLIISVIVVGLLFVIATSGRYILPQMLQLIKVAHPFVTKFVGI